MTVKISQTADVQRFFEEASGQLNERGDPRTKALVRRILDDTAKLIEEMQVTPDEFWKAVDYLNRLGSRQEAGLLAAGLGLEHYLDLLLDAQDAEAGLTGGTPRTIEGPLYVAGAPLSDGEARMDDGRDAGTVMFLQGRVSGPDGQPLAGAIVDVWHANTQGTYSYFDSSQSEYNLRRRIRTDADGRYRARSIVPSGYGCPSDGPTQELLDRLGRHGQRPAHIHFFVSAPGHRHLTTQINLAGDRYLWDDFAYATRDGLIGDLRFNDDPAAARDRGVEGGRFAELDFDFQPPVQPGARRRAPQPAAAGIAGVRWETGRAAGRWRPCRLLPPGATADKKGAMTGASGLVQRSNPKRTSVLLGERLFSRCRSCARRICCGRSSALALPVVASAGAFRAVLSARRGIRRCTARSVRCRPGPG